MAKTIKNKKDLISILDLGVNEINTLLSLAGKIKKRPKDYNKKLQGKTLGIILQKPSTRTVVSFAAGMYQLGGLALTFNAQDLQLRRGETPADTAKVLSRYLNGIVIRANSHQDVLELANHSTIPVINGLTDKEHPCQVLGDLLTLIEAKKLRSAQGLAQLSLVYVGDGNNMANTWLLVAGMLGLSLTLSCPKGYEPDVTYVKKAETLAGNSGATLKFEPAPSAAVTNADVIYTDVWTSMGKDEECEKRKIAFVPYQVNSALISHAKKDVTVMHCLPAHRGEEITNEVLDGKHSIVFDQVENRLHVQKAILTRYLS